jgi:eukaryotic-like serine/threonine-protein kinase
MAYEVGQRIGDYEILALLGSGGMGRVYKVRSIISNREEAMKVLLPDFAGEADLSARFMSEIRTLAGLDHPNIAQLRTAFQSQNEFVMIMEFVEGTTLETLAWTSKIPLDQVLEYSMQVLSALSYAHSRGVIHRDLKPANIMVTSHGLVKLMDFGIAKSSDEKNLTRPGTTMGSVYYISPEQVRGGTVDARSDIYSFGVTLYEMLTGQKPFQADTSYSVLYAQMNEAPAHPMKVNPEIPAALNDIVLHAMEKNPDARFQTAEDFRNALKAVQKQRTEPAGQAPEYAPAAAVLATAALPQAISATAAMSASAVTPPQSGYTPVPVVAPAPAQPQAAFAPAAAAAPVQAASQQGYAPVAVSAPVAPRPAKSHRGLWIALGAVAAILALVAVATVLPRVYAIYAKQKAAATQAPAAQPAADTPPQPSAPAADAASQATSPSTASPEPIAPASGTAATAGPAPATKASTPGGSSSRPANDKTHQAPGSASAAPAASVPSPPPPPPGPSPQEVREVRDRLMNMDSRAGAAQSGVQQLRSQQQAQGLDIRSDMLASMNRMNNDLGEANRALGQKDLETANEYLDRADKELSKLESFLGK